MSDDAMHVSEAADRKVAASFPEYAGAYVDAAGRLVVRLTTSGREQDAGQRLQAELAAMSRSGGRVADLRTVVAGPTARFTFKELASWRSELWPELPPEVNSIDLNEETNRLEIGIGDLGRSAGIRETMRVGGIPDEAVFVFESGPAENDSCPGLLLISRCRPLSGGTGAQAPGTNPALPPLHGICTLGLPVLKAFPFPPAQLVLMAGHCAGYEFIMDGGPLYQPGLGVGTPVVVGNEVWDSTGVWCSASYPNYCRQADVAAYSVNVPDLLPGEFAWGLGIVARPLLGSTTIATPGAFNRLGTFVPLMGLTVNKVGYVTGRTSGSVTATCKDIKSGPAGAPDKWILCATGANYLSAGGDSGSPVVMVGVNDVDVFILGMHFGAGYFSSVSQIDAEIPWAIAF